ncbi:MAG: hypothetical protein WCV84_04380 [Patescibacteria group bacterium]
MKQCSNKLTSSFCQRKVIAAFVLAVILTNSQASASQAASLNLTPAVDAVSSVRTSTAMDIGSKTTEATEIKKEEPAKDEPTVQEVLLNVCQARDYGAECAKTLLGMMWNESSNRSTVIGDGGRARGYFQIHVKLHKISVDCAEDLVCSAKWTLDYLESNMYPKYTSYAVQCHNSCNVNNGYAARALRNGKSFWSKPLEIKQPKPVELALQAKTE